jgi:hypothetical protein
VSEITRNKVQAFPGFFELRTAESMLEKAKRELTRIEAEDSIDHVYNFFVTAYHIVDYLDGRLKEQALNDPLIQKCGDACNKAKHMRLTRRRPDVETTNRFNGAIFNSVAPFNTFAFNECRVERWIDWPKDEPRKYLEVVGFARDVIARWDEIFDNYGIGYPPA